MRCTPGKHSRRKWSSIFPAPDADGIGSRGQGSGKLGLSLSGDLRTWRPGARYHFFGGVANEEQGRNLAVVSGESSNGVGTRASGSQAFLNSEVS